MIQDTFLASINKTFNEVYDAFKDGIKEGGLNTIVKPTRFYLRKDWKVHYLLHRDTYFNATKDTRYLYERDVKQCVWDIEEYFDFLAQHEIPLEIGIEVVGTGLHIYISNIHEEAEHILDNDVYPDMRRMYQINIFKELLYTKNGTTGLDMNNTLEI